MLRLFAGAALAAAYVNEGIRARDLFLERKKRFEQAQARAAALSRPLLVVGDPDSGAVTRSWIAGRAYSCGDLCVDLTGCPACPMSMALDITQGVPGVPDNSAVVFVSCVLEYTSDPNAALKDLTRIAGEDANLFLVTVDPLTLTSFLYPGARWRYDRGQFVPVSVWSKVALGAAMTATSIAALYPGKKAPKI